MKSDKKGNGKGIVKREKFGKIGIEYLIRKKKFYHKRVENKLY